MSRGAATLLRLSRTTGAASNSNALQQAERELIVKALRESSPGTNTLRSMFPNMKEATTLAFHFWSGEFVYLCEDGTRAGLVTNGVGISEHAPDMFRRRPQSRTQDRSVRAGSPGKLSRSTTQSRAGGLT